VEQVFNSDIVVYHYIVIAFFDVPIYYTREAEEKAKSGKRASVYSFVCAGCFGVSGLSQLV